MSYQKIKFCGTKGNFESDQKIRGIKIISDGNDLEEPNPDFCQSFRLDDKHLKWRGYGIESVSNFLSHVRGFKKNISKIYNSKPTSFKDALISTGVVEAANKSLKRKSSWQKVKIK